MRTVRTPTGTGLITVSPARPQQSRPDRRKDRQLLLLDTGISGKCQP